MIDSGLGRVLSWGLGAPWGLERSLVFRQPRQTPGLYTSLKFCLPMKSIVAGVIVFEFEILGL